jgi:signal transduction histidine kinase
MYEESSLSNPTPHPRLLIIDDENEITEMLQSFFRHRGYAQIHVAQAGKQALELAQDHLFDVVITDLRMPDIDGLALAQQLRVQQPDIEVLILTGYATIETVVEALRTRSVFDYLLKPLAFMDELEIAVQKAFRYQQMRNQNRLLLEETQRMNQRLSERVREQTYALQKTYDELHEMSRLKDQFLSNISHELQSPITPLEGYIQLFLEGELGELPTEHKHILGTMEVCVQRLRKQIDNILFLSHLSGEKVELMIDEFFLHDTLYNLEKIFSFPLQQKKQQIIFQTNAQNASILGDIQQISKVMVICLDNAIKFGYENSHIFVKTQNIAGSTLKKRLQYPLEQHQKLFSYLPEDLDPEARYLEVLIEDRGKGIPHTELDSIFESFYQVDGSVTREAGGLGIGLSIARKIIAAHHAMLYLESQEQVGTIISFVLPVAH